MKNRNVSVDLFRFLAALSIMFLHTCWGLDDSLLDAYPIIGIVIGRYPVILFFTISGYYCFLQISKGRNAAKTQIRSLLKVYCVWTVVYYLMSFVLNVAAGHERGESAVLFYRGQLSAPLVCGFFDLCYDTHLSAI